MVAMVNYGSLGRKPWIHEICHAHTNQLLDAGVPVPVPAHVRRHGHQDPQTTLLV
jgi:hypothetical protein